MRFVNRRNAHRLLALLRQRARALVHRPRVQGAVPPMYPGALRIGEAEEEAAVAAVREVLRSKKLFRYYGPSREIFQRSRVRDLERALGERLDATHVLAVNSGTSALACTLAALGIGPGDEVIVPAYTWVSTASSVAAMGAVPVIAEVDHSLTLDVADARKRISPHTRAIIAVHMRGAPAALDALQTLCREHRLSLIEDVAQAFGGSFHGKSLGTIGDLGACSFQMSKILTAGEGGLVVARTRDAWLRAAMYHDSAACPHLGVAMDDWIAGVNLRMSELHAAVLLAQAARLDALLAAMRAHKARLKAIVGTAVDARGGRWRHLHDAEGDTATALIFFLPEARSAAAVVAALGDDNVPASRLYHDLAYLPHDHVDLHAAPAWTPILAGRSWSRSAAPWRDHPRRLAYTADSWPATIDLLRRAVHVDVSPDLAPAQVEQIGEAIVRAVERCT